MLAQAYDAAGRARAAVGAYRRALGLLGRDDPALLEALLAAAMRAPDGPAAVEAARKLRGIRPGHEGFVTVGGCPPAERRGRGGGAGIPQGARPGARVGPGAGRSGSGHGPRWARGSRRRSTCSRPSAWTRRTRSTIRRSRACTRRWAGWTWRSWHCATGWRRRPARRRRRKPPWWISWRPCTNVRRCGGRRSRSGGAPRRSASRNRPLKKAHLRRWPARALAAAYLEYASLGPSRAALHLDLFERPGRKRVVQRPAKPDALPEGHRRPTTRRRGQGDEMGTRYAGSLLPTRRAIEAWRDRSFRRLPGAQGPRGAERAPVRQRGGLLFHAERLRAAGGESVRGRLRPPPSPLAHPYPPRPRDRAHLESEEQPARQAAHLLRQADQGKADPGVAGPLPGVLRSDPGGEGERGLHRGLSPGADDPQRRPDPGGPARARAAGHARRCGKRRSCTAPSARPTSTGRWPNCSGDSGSRRWRRCTTRISTTDGTSWTTGCRSRWRLPADLERAAAVRRLCVAYLRGAAATQTRFLASLLGLGPGGDRRQRSDALDAEGVRPARGNALAGLPGSWVVWTGSQGRWSIARG